MTETRRRLGWRLAAVVLALVQLPVLVRSGSDPGQSDFANYLTPAFVLARGGDLGALYDRDAFAAAMAEAGLPGLGSFVPHPPANALWLLPFASLPPEVAKGLWTGVLVLSLVMTVLAITGLSSRLRWDIALVIALAPTLALRNGLAFGQPYLVLAALLALGVLALEKRHDFVAGFLLGLGVSFKPYALGIGLLFVHRERRFALAGFICGAALPSLTVWSLAGAGPFVEFSNKVLPWMLRGEIQDPFSPAWGSATALANRLFRLEPDLNPHPWTHSPLVARFLGSAIPAGLLAAGVISGRRALASGRVLDAVGISVAFALAASPFTASYHLVLLAVPVTALVARNRGRAAAAVVAGWALLGSEAMTIFRSTSGFLTPLAFLRLGALAVLALALAWPFANRSLARVATGAGLFIGLVGVLFMGRAEVWPRIDAARGYSMMRPYFCGAELRWMSPSADGRRLESHGGGDGCEAAPPFPESEGGAVISRFADGSWNLYLKSGGPRSGDTRLTFSSANEIDSVLAPGGCAVVFASDQGRGLGSTALYRLSLLGIRDGCAGVEPSAAPR